MFEDFLNPPLYSEHGTSQKSREINCFKAFLDAMEILYYEGI